MAKLLESVIHVRLLEQFEPLLSATQYAYRRERGTEFRMAGLSSSVTKAHEKGNHVNSATVDVEAAFDGVPHKNVLQTLQKWGARGHIMRYLQKWLQDRKFDLRLQGPTGMYCRKRKRITRGLPQGGILSPLLWLVHFNSMKELMDESRQQRMKCLEDAGFGRVEICDLFFADDVVIALAHHLKNILTQEAWHDATAFKGHLAIKGLDSTRDKSGNFLLSPRHTLGGLLRRCPNAHRAPAIDLKERDADLCKGDVSTSEEEEEDETPRSLPYPKVSNMKIPGVVFDRSFGFPQHIQTIIARASNQHSQTIIVKPS